MVCHGLVNVLTRRAAQQDGLSREEHATPANTSGLLERPLLEWPSSLKVFLGRRNRESPRLLAWGLFCVLVSAEVIFPQPGVSEAS